MKNRISKNFHPGKVIMINLMNILHMMKVPLQKETTEKSMKEVITVYTIMRKRLVMTVPLQILAQLTRKYSSMLDPTIFPKKTS